MDEFERKPLLPNLNFPEIQEIENSRISNKNLYLSCGAILLGAVNVGIAIGMSSPMIPNMQNDETKSALPMTESEYFWFASIVTLGGMVGGLVGGITSQRIGRKLSGILCGVPFVTGMLMVSYCSNVATLFVGRLLTGFAAGAISLIVPIYISEISTVNTRGLMGIANGVFILSGVFLSYALGIFLHWRWLAAILAAPAAFFSLAMLFVPETPRFLLMVGRRAEAFEALTFLRGVHADVQGELKLVEDSIKESSISISWISLIRDRSIRKPLLLCLASMFFQQGSGVNCVLLYSETILKDAGVTSDTLLNLSAIGLCALQITFSIVSSVLMERAGRKKLLVISEIGVVIGTFFYGLYFELKSHSKGSEHNTWLAIFSLFVTVSGFALGVGPIAWLLISELIPMRARGKASGIAISSNWIFAFLVTSQFHNLEVAITTQGTFWLFTGISMLGVFFGVFVLPETKGKTLEEISKYFDRSARQSITNSEFTMKYIDHEVKEAIIKIQALWRGYCTRKKLHEVYPWFLQVVNELGELETDDGYTNKVPQSTRTIIRPCYIPNETESIREQTNSLESSIRESLELTNDSKVSGGELRQSQGSDTNLKFKSKDEYLKRKSEITMELYWVQQAIESRRNYLLLKKNITTT